MLGGAVGSDTASQLQGSGLIMSSGYCLCGESVCVYLSMWVSSGFYGVLSALKNMLVDRLSTMLLCTGYVPALHAVFTGCESYVIKL